MNMYNLKFLSNFNLADLEQPTVKLHHLAVILEIYLYLIGKS